MRVNAVVNGKCDRCHQFVKWQTRGGWQDQKLKVVLFYIETKSVVATQRCFCAHFGTRWAPCRQFTDFANNLKLMVLCWRRSGPVLPVSVHLWLPHSPDINPCDFFLWGFLKGKVFQRRPENVVQLRAHIVKWRMQGFVCKRLWGKTVVTLNMFFIRNNFPAYEH